MLNPNLAIVVRVALQSADSLPIRERALLYRGLAIICGDSENERSFLQVASNLESIAKELDQVTSELFPTPTYSGTPSADQVAKLAT
jgi:hypothetical protein